MRVPSKRNVIKIVRELSPHDQAALLMYLAPLARIDQALIVRWDKDPIVFPFPLDYTVVERMVQGGVENLPIITVTISVLYSQRFIVCMGQHSESTAAASRRLGVLPSVHVDSRVLCVPEEYTLLDGESTWRLSRPGTADVSFGSDELANAMYMLGVKGRGWRQ